VDQIGSKISKGKAFQKISIVEQDRGSRLGAGRPNE